jgi:hypothetical protein
VPFARPFSLRPEYPLHSPDELRLFAGARDTVHDTVMGSSFACTLSSRMSLPNCIARSMASPALVGAAPANKVEKRRASTPVGGVASMRTIEEKRLGP